MRLIKFRRILRLFLIGAVGYTLIEILWRGHTHWTMSITGGVCFVLIYTIWRRLFAAPWYRVCLCCAAAVTGVEFVVGCIVNLLLGWNVWSDLPAVQYSLVLSLCAFAAALPSSQKKGDLLMKNPPAFYVQADFVFNRPYSVYLNFPLSPVKHKAQAVVPSILEPIP